MSSSLASNACILLGKDWPLADVSWQPLTPDGSSRQFCRLQHRNGQQVICIAPPDGDVVALKEAVGGWHIGCHLLACDAPVPELFAFDRQTGLLVCEDLGDVRLHDQIFSMGRSSQEVHTLYEQVVIRLARMQVQAKKNFNPDWCWDTPRYDRKLMLERESGYFLNALCQDMLNLQVDEAALCNEFSVLADQVSCADAGFFLHRDFQSRNIMVLNDEVRFIDYQAGRLGPLGYDLASLIIDPYAALDRDLQEKLIDRYLAELIGLITYDTEEFKSEFLLLAVQRNLQILGAFAFLSQQCNKPFFQQYIQPALHSLQHNISILGSKNYPFLTKLVDQCLTDV
jgi:aminoglycoside/choline kinase family phosphotransferase